MLTHCSCSSTYHNHIYTTATLYWFALTVYRPTQPITYFLVSSNLFVCFFFSVHIYCGCYCYCVACLLFLFFFFFLVDRPKINVSITERRKKEHPLHYITFDCITRTRHFIFGWISMQTVAVFYSNLMETNRSLGKIEPFYLVCWIAACANWNH